MKQKGTTSTANEEQYRRELFEQKAETFEGLWKTSKYVNGGGGGGGIS